MGWQKLVILSLLGVLIQSCCMPLLQKKFYTTEFGGERPLKSKFKLAKTPYILKDEDVIKTNLIYTTSFKMEGGKKSEYTSFLRFFDDGRFLSNALDTSSPLLDQYNNLKKGGVGYYKIEGNTIRLEEFVVGAQDCGKYHEYTLPLSQDGIKGYTHTLVNALSGAPDW